MFSTVLGCQENSCEGMNQFSAFNDSQCNLVCCPTFCHSYSNKMGSSCLPFYHYDFRNSFQSVMLTENLLRLNTPSKNTGTIVLYSALFVFYQTLMEFNCVCAAFHSFNGSFCNLWKWAKTPAKSQTRQAHWEYG